MAKTPEITDKFLSWLRKLEEDHGDRAGVARELGQSHDYAARILDGKRSPNISLSKLGEFAQARGGTAWGIVKEIEKEEPLRSQAGSDDHRVVVSINNKYADAWDRLFQSKPIRGKRVLTNLLQQEELGYTDLVSRIVRLILEHGPKEAIAPIVRELSAFEDRKETTKRRNLRAQLAAEYKKLR